MILSLLVGAFLFGAGALVGAATYKAVKDGTI